MTPKSSTRDAYVIRRVADGGVVYCGITSCGVLKRWRDHVYNSKRNPRYLLAQAIKEFGPEAFAIEHIGSARSSDDAGFFETQLIEQYRTLIPEGYNMTLGIVDRTRRLIWGKRDGEDRG